MEIMKSSSVSHKMESNSNFIFGPSGIPLWTRTGVYLDRHKLYDLEIYSDSDHVDLDKDIDDILNINTHKCHICNIDVPSSYMKEHLSSSKHETCLKIANIALTRTQNHMKNDMSLKMNRLKLEVKETYFCDNCAIVVKNVDKETHVTSVTHLGCVKNDTLLQNLVDVYEAPQIFKCDGFALNDNRKEDKISDEFKIGDDNNSEMAIKKHIVTKYGENDMKIKQDNSANMKTLDEVTIRCHENSEPVKKVTGDDQNTKINQKRKNNKATPIKNTIGNEIAKKQNEMKEHDTHESKQTEELAQGTSEISKELVTSEAKNASAVKSTSQYEEVLVDLKHFLQIAQFLHKDTVHVTAYSEEIVEIVGANVERIRVPLVNFHGYHVTGQAVVCKICLDIKSVDGKKHKWTDLHMKNIMLPLTKQHLRQINDTSLHCILCNIVVSTTEAAQHTTSAEHKEYLQEYKVSKDLTFKIKL